MQQRKTKTLKYFLRESLIALPLRRLPDVICDGLLPFRSGGASNEPPLPDGTLAFIYYTFALIVSVMVVASPPEGIPVWMRPPRVNQMRLPVWMGPPNANQPRPGPAAIPTAITGIMAINELRGLLVLAIAAALTEPLNGYCNHERKNEDGHEQRAACP